MMCQFVNVLDVAVLPVYRPSKEEMERPELFAANVRAVFLEASGMRCAEQSQREFVALTKVPAAPDCVPSPGPLSGRPSLHRHALNQPVRA